MKLTDFTKMSRKSFWEMVNQKGDAAKDTFEVFWKELDERVLSQKEAVECLDALFIYSHLRIKQHSSALAKHYPTTQLTKNRLAKRENLWWVDHFTAGISRWSTLSWFSAAKRKKKSGKMGLAGASTHFIQGYHGHPFYIIPLMHAAWHEPRRNKDSISIETVNAGKLQLDKASGAWKYWANTMPLGLVQELPPVMLDTPYRGCKVMQPYTQDQFVNNIKLKRLVITALSPRLTLCRMSQHTDWREHKTDMGVLWPFEECNSAAFAADPIPELDFIQGQEYQEFLDAEGTLWDETAGWEDHDETENPSYGETTPTHDDDDDPDENVMLSTTELQAALVQAGYTVKIDGIPGRKTSAALKNFQRDWNKKNPKDPVKVDGIPGPQTCKRLKT